MSKKGIPWNKIIGIITNSYARYRAEGGPDDPESPDVVTPLEWMEIQAKAELEVIEAFGESVE